MKHNYRWILLIALTIMIFIINVDYTAVNLALIPMAGELNASLNAIQWVLSAYVLAWAVLVIPAGKYADKYGKKRLCLIGLSMFLLASMLAGIANSTAVLIAARILQGIAGAIYVSTMYALIYLHFSEQQRGRAIGLMSLGVGLGMAVGPLIGGLLLAAINWRSIFFINIPIGLIALLIIYASKDVEHLQADSTMVDKKSMSLLGIGIISLLYVISGWQAWSHDPLLYQALTVICILSISFFIVLQKRATAPIIPVALFSNLPFVGCCVGILLEQYAFSVIIVATGIYLQKILHLSVFVSSLIYLSLTIIFGIIAALGGNWVDRIGIRLPTTIGLLLIAAGSLLFTLLFASSNLWLVSTIFIILGAGMGLAFSGLNTGIVKTVSQQYIGIASSLFVMFALLGNSFGVTCTTMIYESSSIAQLIDLLQQVGVALNQLQLQQLSDYVANISAAIHNLTAFNQTTQTLITQNTVTALSGGIANTMLTNFLIALFAAVCCGFLLKQKIVSSNATEQKLAEGL